MAKRKPEPPPSKESPTKKKKTKDKKVVNSLANYFGPPISTSSRVGLQSAALQDPSSTDDDTALMDPEQLRVLNAAVHEGKSLFFTGPAGTGKSILLQTLIHALKRKFKNQPSAVAITASTGIAATNIGGLTLHAWASLSSNIKIPTRMAQHVRKIPGSVARWKDTKVLVIDEISLVDAETFDMLDSLAKTFHRDNFTPFGGMQLILTGDFFQLPPITEKDAPIKFAFESKAWPAVIKHTFLLTKVYRQKDDDFVNLLAEVRLSRLSPSTIAKIRTLRRPLSGSAPATELFAVRTQVNSANHAHLESLTTPSHTYTSRDSGTAPEQERSRLLDGMLAPATLTLKIDAQVMLVRNLDTPRGLCNGAVGVVQAFRRAPKGEAFKRSSSFCDYAVHEAELIDLATGLPPVTHIAHDGQTTRFYPVVRFYVRHGEVTILVKDDELCIKDQYEATLAKRVQIPLMLAWAISIHKSQGQTLHRVILNLDRVFQYGQAYVAISRASNLEGLQVLGFDPAKVKTHKRVMEWYNALGTHSSQASEPQAGTSKS